MFRADRPARLAEQMHALKVRTNRSYEALANRVGVSRSTLHRYCRGETVPPDYEVIARFGRVCGASKEEIEELLRSWVRTVDAGRGRVASGPGWGRRLLRVLGFRFGSG